MLTTVKKIKFFFILLDSLNSKFTFGWGEKGDDGKWRMKNIIFPLFGWSEHYKKLSP